jgi:hypothetical protein
MIGERNGLLTKTRKSVLQSLSRGQPSAFSELVTRDHELCKNLHKVRAMGMPSPALGFGRRRKRLFCGVSGRPRCLKSVHKRRDAKLYVNSLASSPELGLDLI